MSGSEFAGFSHNLIAFLAGLKANNERAWFEARKGDYETLFKEPARDFVAAMSGRLGEIAEGLTAEPKIGGSIHRINRDTRFSKDKTPYNTHLHFVFWRGAKPAGSSGFHFVISPTDVGAGVGNWAFGPDQLTRFRAAVADPAKGAVLAEAIKIGMAGPGMILDPPALKRVPAGFDAEAPHADLLKHKGIVVRGDGAIPDALFGLGAVDLALALFRPLIPVHDWLMTHAS
ncbi:MAG TPA: DUF2461 domain-containing protein [Alphaproteobacteria bacterium]|nr:DUF2461 domain-containing protein [Alphaproteobacteria bacterium]